MSNQNERVPQMEPPQPGRLNTRGEVAALFHVAPETVTRWANTGKVPHGAVIVTLGGHRRYRESWARDALNGGQS